MRLSHGNGKAAGTGPRFTFARCKQALPRELVAQRGIPLPGEELEVLHRGLPWEAFAVRIVLYGVLFLCALLSCFAVAVFERLWHRPQAWRSQHGMDVVRLRSAF